MKKERKETKKEKLTHKQPKPAKEAKQGVTPKGILAAVLAVLLLGAGYAALCSSVNPDLVLPRTRMVYRGASGAAAGDSSAEAAQEPTEPVLDVSGLSRESVEQSLREDFHRRFDGRTITVRAGERNYIVPVGNTLSVDEEALTQAALAPSQVPFARRGLSRLRSLLMDRDVEVAPKATNQDLLRTNLQSSGVTALDTTVQTTFETKDKQLVMHKGRSGQSVDQEALLQQLTEAVEAGSYNTPVESAMREGQVSAIDWEAVEKQVFREPQNASLKLSKNRRKYQIVEAVTGVSFDRAAAQQALEAVPEGADATIPLKFSAPEITTKRMKNKLFKHKLGTYTTPVSGTWERISNVRLAAEKCDGIILCKGDRFSYNDTLGQRTRANGFYEAGAYLNGTTVQEVGGGICQISSTMYAAALNANLKILERHNHTFASSYIGLGLDATVSWGGPDFRWENDKEYPIKIEANYWDGYATVTLWGTRTDDLKVEMIAETKETIPFETIYREDPDMYEGKTRVSQHGSDGYRVQTYRKITEDGKQVSKEKEAYSVYKPHEEIVYEGTKVRKPKKVEPEKTDETKPEETDPNAQTDPQSADQTAQTAAAENTAQTDATTDAAQPSADN